MASSATRECALTLVDDVQLLLHTGDHVGQVLLVRALQGVQELVVAVCHGVLVTQHPVQDVLITLLPALVTLWTADKGCHIYTGTCKLTAYGHIWRSIIHSNYNSVLVWVIATWNILKHKYLHIEVFCCDLSFAWFNGLLEIT